MYCKSLKILDNLKVIVIMLKFALWFKSRFLHPKGIENMQAVKNPTRLLRSGSALFSKTHLSKIIVSQWITNLRINIPPDKRKILSYILSTRVEAHIGANLSSSSYITIILPGWFF